MIATFLLFMPLSWLNIFCMRISKGATAPGGSWSVAHTTQLFSRRAAPSPEPVQSTSPCDVYCRQFRPEAAAQASSQTRSTPFSTLCRQSGQTLFRGGAMGIPGFSIRTGAALLLLPSPPLWAMRQSDRCQREAPLKAHRFRGNFAECRLCTE